MRRDTLGKTLRSTIADLKACSAGGSLPLQKSARIKPLGRSEMASSIEKLLLAISKIEPNGSFLLTMRAGRCERRLETGT
jgi:hypothetical protein